MKRSILILLAGLVALCGCRRSHAPKNAESDSTVTPPTEQPVSAPAPAPASAATAKAGANTPPTANYVPGTTAYDDLSRHLAWFVVSKKRFPADVDELLAANRLPKPVLPPGGKLVINKQTKTVDYVGPK